MESTAGFEPFLDAAGSISIGRRRMTENGDVGIPVIGVNDDGFRELFPELN